MDLRKKSKKSRAPGRPRPLDLLGRPRGGPSAASRSAKLTRLGGRLDVPGRLPWPVGGRLPRGVLWPVCGRLPVGGRLPEARRSASIVCTATSRYELQAAPLSVRCAGARMIPSRGGTGRRGCAVGGVGSSDPWFRKVRGALVSAKSALAASPRPAPSYRGRAAFAVVPAYLHPLRSQKHLLYSLY